MAALEETPAEQVQEESRPVADSTVIATPVQQLPEENVEPWERLQVGDTVVHKSLGPGEVMSLDDKYLIVKFPDRESKFLFPSAFEKGYLSIEK